MADFATPPELATLLRTASEAEAAAGNPDVLDTGTAVLALGLATADIRAACHWSITRETVTDVPVDPGDWRTGLLFLPTMYLVDVAITVNGAAAAAGDFTFTRSGRLTLSGRAWPALADVRVTYTHGYEDVPSGVRSVALLLAASYYLNPTGARSQSSEGWSETLGSPPDLATDARLAPYRLPVVL